MITAILIDPNSKKVSLLENFKGDLNSLYNTMKTDLVGFFSHDQHGFYYDDNISPENTAECWTFPEFGQWIAGKAIIVSSNTDEEGNNLSADRNYLQIILQKIKFLNF